MKQVAFLPKAWRDKKKLGQKVPRKAEYCQAITSIFICPPDKVLSVAELVDLSDRPGRVDS